MKYRPSSYHPSNQTVAVLRPLIWCPQNDLSILCSEKGLNSHGKNGCGTSLADTSSYLHRLLQEDSDVFQAAQELQEDMDRFGRDVRRKGTHFNGNTGWKNRDLTMACIYVCYGVNFFYHPVS